MIESEKLILLHSKLAKIIKSFNGTVAIAFSDLNNESNKFFYNENLEFHAASTFKTAVMLEVFKQVSEKKFSLDDTILVKNEFRSIVDGLVYTINVHVESDDKLYSKLGSYVKIHNLVYDMITVSSNLATNLLTELVKPENVTNTLINFGIFNMKVIRGVEDLKAYRLGLNNKTTAFDLLQIYKLIATKSILDETSCDKMIEILSAQSIRDRIPKYLPTDVIVAHKTGSISKIEHDGGIIFLPDGKKYVLVVLTSDFENSANAKEVIAQVSKVCYDHMVSK